MFIGLILKAIPKSHKYPLFFDVLLIAVNGVVVMYTVYVLLEPSITSLLHKRRMKQWKKKNATKVNISPTKMDTVERLFGKEDTPVGGVKFSLVPKERGHIVDMIRRAVEWRADKETILGAINTAAEEALTRVLESDERFSPSISPASSNVMTRAEQCWSLENKNQTDA